MKDFVLYHSSEIPHNISEEEFERHTKSEYPFKQNYDRKNHYFATCPECENTIQLKGLYSSDRKYGTHTGKSINGFPPFNYLNYVYCPRSVQGRHVPKEARKEITSAKDIAVYNTVRENFDLALSFAKKHLGYYISDEKAMECLETYYASQGWLYPHSTVNNIPFILFYLQPAINPYGLWIKKDSELERAIMKVRDLSLNPVENRASKYYSKLLPNSNRYTSLTMMLWNHQFKENSDGVLQESINVEICKDVSTNPEMHEWKTLLDKKIMIPELEFVKFIHSDKVHRNKALRDYAYHLMPPVEEDA